MLSLSRTPFKGNKDSRVYGNQPRTFHLTAERSIIRTAIKREDTMALRKFMIERDIPGVGDLDSAQLCGAAGTSNAALAKLGPDIQWVESFVADNKTFCVYLAKNEEVIRKHAELSGFPANKITPIGKIIDPTTEKTG